MKPVLRGCVPTVEFREEVGKIGSESRLSTSYPQVIHEFITTSKSSKCKQLSISRNGVLGNNKIGRKWRGLSCRVFSGCVWISLAAFGMAAIHKSIKPRWTGIVGAISRSRQICGIARRMEERNRVFRKKTRFREEIGGLGWWAVPTLQRSAAMDSYGIIQLACVGLFEFISQFWLFRTAATHQLSPRL